MKIILSLIISFVVSFASTISKSEPERYILSYKNEIKGIIKQDINNDKKNDYVICKETNNTSSIISFISENNDYKQNEIMMKSNTGLSSNTDIKVDDLNCLSKNEVLKTNNSQIIISISSINNRNAYLLFNFNQNLNLWESSFGYYFYTFYDIYGNAIKKQTYIFFPNFVIGKNTFTEIMDITPFYDSKDKYHSSLSKENLEKLVEINPFSKSNIAIYNDTAYYLQQANANDEAIFLLEKIIEKFPNRTVAYLNLADAYLGKNESEKAKVNYEKYINLMKQDNKESKIPQRVLEFK